MPAARPRFFGHAYTKTEYRKYLEALKMCLKVFWRGKPYDQPLSVKIEFYLKMPKKPKHAFPTKGDLDNYTKAILDAGNKILWSDDRFIVDLSAQKQYSNDPRVVIKFGIIQ